MKERGVEFPNACRILEVCNPHQASRVLSQNMAVSMALPCRISVFQDAGQTRIATMLPTAMLAVFPGSEALKPIAEEVEQQILTMIDEAK